MGNVLVVDDEAAVRRVLALALRSQGHTILEADDGVRALEVLAERDVDLVITDWRMPRMSGDELLAEVQRRHPGIDVIMMTGYGSIESAVQAMQAGAADYMTKPLDLNAVREKVTLRMAERSARLSVPTVSPMEPLIRLSKAITQSQTVADMLDGAMDVVETAFSPTAVRLATHGGPLRADLVVAFRGRAELLAGWPLPPMARLEEVAAQPEPWTFVDAEGRTLGPSTREAAGLLVPLAGERVVVGSLTLLRAEGASPYTREDARSLRFLAHETGRALEADHEDRRVDAQRDVRRAMRSITQVLARVIETYDAFTHEHSCRMARISQQLARCAGLSDEEVENIGMASLLHDIGKVGVAMTTLHKPMKLTATEYDLVKLHPAMGARILAGLDILGDLVPLVLYHHEWVDGSGYPDGLVGDDIPLGARVIAVADVYDSLTYDRPYRQALSEEEAQRRLAAAAGTQLDQGLVRVWLQCLEQGVGGEEGDAQCEVADA